MVKKGSKAFARVSASMPKPSSEIRTTASSPLRAVEIVTLPPLGIASRALMQRFMIDASSCAASALTCPAAGSSSSRRMMVSPSADVQQLLHGTYGTIDIQESAGSSGCRPAKVRSWRVRAAPCRDALWFNCAIADSLRIGDFVGQGLRRPDDDRQQVVEVMGDAARQLADRFEALCLQPFCLVQPCFGDVADATDHARRLAGGIADDMALIEDLGISPRSTHGSGTLPATCRSDHQSRPVCWTPRLRGRPGGSWLPIPEIHPRPAHRHDRRRMRYCCSIAHGRSQCPSPRSHPSSSWRRSQSVPRFRPAVPPQSFSSVMSRPVATKWVARPSAPTIGAMLMSTQYSRPSLA